MACFHIYETQKRQPDTMNSALRRIAHQIAHLPYETLVIVDAKGNEVLRRTGGRYNVPITLEDEY